MRKRNPFNGPDEFPVTNWLIDRPWLVGLLLSIAVLGAFALETPH